MVATLAIRLLLPIAYAFSVYNGPTTAKVGYVLDVVILAISVILYAKARLDGVGDETAFLYVVIDVASRALTVAVCTLGCRSAVMIGLALNTVVRECAKRMGESLEGKTTLSIPTQYQHDWRLLIIAFELAMLRCMPFMVLGILLMMKYCFGLIIPNMEWLPEMMLKKSKCFPSF